MDADSLLRLTPKDKAHLLKIADLIEKWRKIKCKS